MLVIFVFAQLFFYVTAKPCVVKKFEQVEGALSCKNIILDNLIVPAGVTLKLNLTDGAEVVFRGNTTFGFKHWDGPLVTINGTGVTIKGEKGSIIDGQGSLYWDGKGGWSNQKPQFFTVQLYGGSVFKDIHIINTPKDVIQVTNSDDVILKNWFIDNLSGDPGIAPKGKEGHNTDGFDVWNSTNLIITNSTVYNQDDCVALRCGANISVSHLYCHGSHGLSISVGFSNDSIPLNTLRNVTFSDSVVESSVNGIHIKTHVDGGYGNITGVTYKNIKINGITSNAILIHQNYQNKGPTNFTDALPRNNVPIRDLMISNVTGAVREKAVPVEIICAEEGCFKWKFNNVEITGGKANKCNFTPEGFSC